MSVPMAIEGLEVDYSTISGRQDLALKGLDLVFEPGNVTVVYGPSGSGKSTLLACLSGLQIPSSGRVTFDGKVLGYDNDDGLSRFRRENIGFIFQDARLAPSLPLLVIVE